MKRYRAFAVALLLDLVGAVGVLLVALRTWQVITTPRPSPLHDAVLDVSGRTIDGASFALALVALAGVVAVLATRGLPRRVVGAVLALAGVVLIWRSASAAGAVSAGRARALVTERQRTVVIDSHVVPHVATHPVWAVLSVVGGVVIAASGALIAGRGHRWQVMSARYEAAPPIDVEADAAKSRATLWNALDRGEDPTS
jgi:uncharacterized membrane protein (TIGR02234 family)